MTLPSLVGTSFVVLDEGDEVAISLDDDAYLNRHEVDAIRDWLSLWLEKE